MTMDFYFICKKQNGIDPAAGAVESVTEHSLSFLSSSVSFIHSMGTTWLNTHFMLFFFF